MKAAVIVSPGSNCDRDVQVALRQSVGNDPVMHWHGDPDLPGVDLIVVPGGFSYGDYLRAGAMAAHSPVIREVVDRAADDPGRLRRQLLEPELRRLVGTVFRPHHGKDAQFSQVGLVAHDREHAVVLA